jgi:transcriptional regulator with GAF, ATPase, and Fis domain
MLDPVLALEVDSSLDAASNRTVARSSSAPLNAIPSHAVPLNTASKGASSMSASSVTGAPLNTPSMLDSVPIPMRSAANSSEFDAPITPRTGTLPPPFDSQGEADDEDAAHPQVAEEDEPDSAGAPSLTERADSVAALQNAGWNISRAARLLSMTRHGLKKRMRRLGIRRPGVMTEDE